MLHDGVGVTQNLSEAFKWMSMAAENDITEAIYSLGIMYWEGRVVKRDYQKAFQLILRAAEAGYAVAQHTIGSFYLQGEVTQIDMGKAFLYFIQAAKQGMQEAQYNVAVCYCNGDGIERNIEKAYYWAKIASYSQDEDALQLLHEISKIISKENISRINADVDRYISGMNQGSQY
jgi:TPR repeat protein